MSRNPIKTNSVAIFMVTYNHEKYVCQAVESIVSQKTSFPFKLFIGEDFSTDSTRDICIKLKEKYPDKIELLLTEKNIGALQNAFRVYEACITYGKHTAICEGDDYWTDKNKLQKQFDFLEANPEFNICCHRAKVLNEKTKTIKTPKVLKQTVFSQEDVANHNFIQTLTMMFRNSAWKGLPEAYFNSISGDYFINMMLSESGKIKYFSDVMAVYRQHEGGAWTGKTKTAGLQATLNVLYAFLNTDLSETTIYYLKRNIVKHHLQTYKLLMSDNPKEAAKQLEMISSPELSEAYTAELAILLNQNNRSRDYKAGNKLLKPYREIMNLKTKFAFFFHQFKYN